jgi:hypothetical protein
MTTEPERRPDPAETVEDEPGEYTTLDEGGMESFPASDPVAVDVDEPIGEKRATDSPNGE